MDAIRELPPIAWVRVAGALVAGVLLTWFARWYRQRRARKRLVSAVIAAGSKHLADVLVPDGMNGFYHVDFVLLTPRGILVVDLRDVRGNIFGGDQMTEWTVMDGSRRFTFTNPQSALYDRVAAVKAIVDDSPIDVPVEGRIVFTRRGKFPKGLPKWTLMVDSLRAEFPAVERVDGPGPYDEAWQRIVEAVKPSSMNHARPIAG
ncbi:MAG TPA: nuclease-related domain-containing protein [Steroidobacteraceae bacterium]